MSAFVYMLVCADGSYYVGSARGDSLDKRMSEHQSGLFGGYTSTRRPVKLIYHEHFDRITDAIGAERRIKGWNRAKKEALIRGDWADVQWFARRSGVRASRAAARPPQHEECGVQPTLTDKLDRSTHLPPYPEVAAQQPSKEGSRDPACFEDRLAGHLGMRTE